MFQWSWYLNWSPPSAAYMCQSIGLALVQIMACRLFGAKPLSKPMLGYCQLDPWGTNFSEILIKIQNFSFTKIHLKLSSVKWWPVCPGGEELISSGDGVVPVRHQSITSTNDDLLSVGALVTNKYKFETKCETLCKQNTFKNIISKMTAILFGPQLTTIE